MKPSNQDQSERPSRTRHNATPTAQSIAAGSLLVGVLVCVLIALLPSRAIGAPSKMDRVDKTTARHAGAGDAAEICDDVTTIPAAECLALVDLFNQTKGENWLINTGWMTVSETVTPCDWYGVVCKNGHVNELTLSDNGLGGNLPTSLADLASLTRLMLDRNAIGGAIGPSICVLAATIQQVELDYNRLSASGNRTRGCLDQLDPDWSATQTVAPADLKVTSIEESALELSWSPIDYVDDGGYYVVGVAAALDGPYTVHGQTADKLAATYRVDGLSPGRTYYLRVSTFTPVHGDQANDLMSDPVLRAAATSATESVLLAVYFGADNDLDSYARIIHGRLLRGTQNNPNVTVVALIDRLGDDNTQVWIMAGGIAAADSGFLASMGAGSDIKEGSHEVITEVDTSDPDVLSAFLTYAKSVAPSDITIASIIGHGVGLAPELTAFSDSTGSIQSAAADQGIPALPRQKDHTPTDVTNRSYMSTPELGRALAAATDNGADPFDLIFFDQCFAGNLDVLYEVRSAAKVFVASPNYAWLVAPYSRYIAEFSPARTPEQMAAGIIINYQRSLNDRHPNAILAVRGVDITAIAGAVDSLANHLMLAVEAGEADKIGTSAANSRFADTTQCGAGNLSLGPPDEMIGAGKFAANLQRAFGPGDTHGVHAAAGELITALDTIRSTFRIGAPYLEPDEFWDYDDTITLLAPLARTTRPDVAWRASIYREMEGESAIWSPMPEVSVTLGSSFAYVRDGKWDEFIDIWYTEPMSPTVGQWCNYTPPARVVSDTVESMTMEAEDGAPDTVKLIWSEVSDTAVGDYLIHARRPGDIGWTQIAALPAPAAAYEVAIDSSERHRFIVVATDIEGVIIAKSETVDWAGSDNVIQRIYLPTIMR